MTPLVFSLLPAITRWHTGGSSQFSSITAAQMNQVTGEVGGRVEAQVRDAVGAVERVVA